MFDALSDRLERISTRLRGKGRISDEDLDEALKEIRTALLEADVELGVARRFCDGIRLRVSTEALAKSLTPGQQVVRAVHEELIGVLGGDTLKLTYASRPPTVVLMAGLQGSGKTTNSAKLALWWKQQGRNPLRTPQQLHRRSCDDAQRSFRSYKEAGQVVPGTLSRFAAEVNDLAVGEHNFQAGDMVHRHPVHQGVRTAGILSHVAADGASFLAGRVGREVQPKMCHSVR